MKDVSDGLLAQWTVKIDVNGYVSGFGLASTLGNAVPTSLFIVNADKFAIAPAMPGPIYSSGALYARNDLVRKQQTPGTGPYHVFQARQSQGPPGESHTPVWGAYRVEDDAWWMDLNARLPFIATTSATMIDGKLYPPGVWMQTANIAEATIVSAQIENLTANKIAAGTIDVGIYVQSGIIWGGNVTVQQLDDPSPGTPVVPPGTTGFGSGYWMGNDAGTFKFFIGNSNVSHALWDGTNFKVIGWIVGTAGSIGGINMTNNTLYSGAAAPAQTFTSGNGFFLDGAVGGLGRMRVGNAAGSRMQWDGSALSIYGPTNNLILSSGAGIDWASMVGTPPPTVANSNITIQRNGANIELVGANGSVLNVVMQGNPINAGNITTYISGAAIGTAQIGLAQITTALIRDAAIATAKIADLQVASFKIKDFAVVVPTTAGWPVANGSQIVNAAGDTVLLGAPGGGGWFSSIPLEQTAPTLICMFTCELEQAAGSSGASITLTCTMQNIASGATYSKTFVIGIINNQPRFAQTAVFTFTEATVPPWTPPATPVVQNYRFKLTGRQTFGSSANNLIWNQVMTVQAMQK
jgi:hypothetical protein